MVLLTSNADIADRDATISSLKSKLDKTVVASTEATRKASNRDEEVKQLKSKISASTKVADELNIQLSTMEDMLAEYQQAYANIYATALGTSVTGLPVTAATSVKDLENLIQAATNTSNIGVAPSYYEDEELDTPVDIINDTDDGSDLVTL